MQARFETKKAQIVQRLARPEHEYNDSSPKGSVDESIRELVNEINSTPGYVTTSSCSGRVAVYLEGPKHDKSTNETQNRRANEANRSSSTSGKGGGRWLFTSHNPVDITDFDNESSIYSLLDIEPAQSLSFPVHGQKNQLVHLKFEPMVRGHKSSMSLYNSPYLIHCTKLNRNSFISFVRSFISLLPRLKRHN